MPKTCEWCKKLLATYRVWYRNWETKGIESIDVCTPCKFIVQSNPQVSKIRKLKTPKSSAGSGLPTPKPSLKSRVCRGKKKEEPDEG